jgi:hypothetical protein
VVVALWWWPAEPETTPYALKSRNICHSLIGLELSTQGVELSTQGCSRILVSEASMVQ